TPQPAPNPRSHRAGAIRIDSVAEYADRASRPSSRSGAAQGAIRKENYCCSTCGMKNACCGGTPHSRHFAILPIVSANSAPRRDVAMGRVALSAYRLSGSILAPSTDTPAIRPAFVSENATTGSFMVLVSIRPLAPTVAIATVASTPAVQPELLRKSLRASCVMNRMMMERDCAPAWRPKDPAEVL